MNQNFEEVMNELTVEVNRVGMRKAIEILRAANNPVVGQEEVPSEVILKLRQIRYDLAERPDQTSLNLIVESIEEILCALGDNPPMGDRSTK